jgi:hypothetical protein
MPSRFVIGLLAAAVSISPLRAQMRGSAGVAHVSSGRGIVGGFAHARFRPFGPGRTFLAAPYLYSDYFSEPDVIPAPASPQVVVVQSGPTAAVVPEAKPRELLIEWQGDHYARITSAESGGIHGQPAPPDYAESTPRVSGAHNDPQARARELPLVVLLFKDGRKEEVKSYTIVSSVMYSSADYWSSGSWTKKIQLADLDVPATLKLNQERGVKFVLPSAANEVVTRP